VGLCQENDADRAALLRRGQPSRFGSPIVVVDDLILDTGSGNSWTSMKRRAGATECDFISMFATA
jgi:hypothetical protein